MRRIFISCIKSYQYLMSPLMASHCRFHPSCSSYAIQSIEQHGVLRGCFLATKRLLRCHPFHPGGFDPVPENKTIPDRHIEH